MYDTSLCHCCCAAIYLFWLTASARVRLVRYVVRGKRAPFRSVVDATLAEDHCASAAHDLSRTWICATMNNKSTEKTAVGSGQQSAVSQWRKHTRIKVGIYIYHARPPPCTTAAAVIASHDSCLHRGVDEVERERRTDQERTHSKSVGIEGSRDRA